MLSILLIIAFLLMVTLLLARLIGPANLKDERTPKEPL